MITMLPTGDGLTNYYEYRFGFNPLLPLSPGNTGNDLTAALAKRNIETTDEDEDGLTGGDELFYGTNPQLSDTNNDGIGDGLALHLNLSLTSNDTDSDGISNALEAANGTNPLVSDTDGDGIRDDVDAYALDPERSTFTPGGAGDGVAPIITLLEPFGAVPQP